MKRLPAIPVEPYLVKRWVVLQMLYEDALKSLDTVFTEMQTVYMPVKGSYLIWSGLASRIIERNMVDLDILVNPTDFDRVVASLKGHPSFEISKPDPWDFEQAFVYHMGGHTITIEIHSKLNREERFLLPTEELFVRGNFQSQFRCLPSIEDALVMLIGHTLVHIGGGIKRSVPHEIEVLFDHESFSAERFLHILKSTGIEPFGLALIYRCTGRRVSASRCSLIMDTLLLLIPKFNAPFLCRVFFRGAIEPFLMRDPMGIARCWFSEKLLPGMAFLQKRRNPIM